MRCKRSSVARQRCTTASSSNRNRRPPACLIQLPNSFATPRKRRRRRQYIKARPSRSGTPCGRAPIAMTFRST
jgi:hypothetical protein